MRLAIEMQNTKGYGHIHKAGCRDLQDPETLGEASTIPEAEAIAEGLTGWDYEPGGYHFAPCTKELTK